MAPALEALPASPPAVVVDARPGPRTAAGDPVTRFVVRDEAGRRREVALVAGPSARGGRVALAGGPSWAPGSPPGVWPDATLPVRVALGGPSRDLGAAAEAELALAARTWSEVACTRFRLVAGAPESQRPADDGKSTVWFEEVAWPPELVPGVLAQTVVRTDGQGRVYDADIWINAVDHRFARGATSGKVDARGVLVHELGHLLGLGHATDPAATMFPTTSGVRWRSLEADDRAGVCALYPGQGATPCPSTPCPPGAACVAGRCQGPREPADVCAPCERVPGACEAAGDDARCVDVGAGAAAGRVCGRACASTADCGPGFACKPTTEAGDLQCVADDACASAGWPCSTDADCASGRCAGGSCKGASGLPADAGAAGSADAAAAAPPPEVGGGGCGCRATAPPGASPLGGALVVVAWLVGRRARRPR